MFEMVLKIFHHDDDHHHYPQDHLHGGGTEAAGSGHGEAGGDGEAGDGRHDLLQK